MKSKIEAISTTTNRLCSNKNKKKEMFELIYILNSHIKCIFICRKKEAWIQNAMTVVKGKLKIDIYSFKFWM